jgi:hypothetical protein
MTSLEIQKRLAALNTPIALAERFRKLAESAVQNRRWTLAEIPAGASQTVDVDTLFSDIRQLKGVASGLINQDQMSASDWERYDAIQDTIYQIRTLLVYALAAEKPYKEAFTA